MIVRGVEPEQLAGRWVREEDRAVGGDQDDAVRDGLDDRDRPFLEAPALGLGAVGDHPPRDGVGHDLHEVLLERLEARRARLGRDEVERAHDLAVDADRGADEGPQAARRVGRVARERLDGPRVSVDDGLAALEHGVAERLADGDRQAGREARVGRDDGLDAVDPLAVVVQRRRREDADGQREHGAAGAEVGVGSCLGRAEVLGRDAVEDLERVGEGLELGRARGDGPLEAEVGAREIALERAAVRVVAGEREHAQPAFVLDEARRGLHRDRPAVLGDVRGVERRLAVAAQLLDGARRREAVLGEQVVDGHPGELSGGVAVEIDGRLVEGDERLGAVGPERVHQHGVGEGVEEGLEARLGGGERRHGRVLLLDVGVDADPLGDLAVGVADGRRADVHAPVHAVGPADPVRVDVRRARPDGLAPHLVGVSAVVRVHGDGVARAHQLVRRHARKGAPAGLRLGELALGRGGPYDGGCGLDERPVSGFLAGERRPVASQRVVLRLLRDVLEDDPDRAAWQRNRLDPERPLSQPPSAVVDVAEVLPAARPRDGRVGREARRPGDGRHDLDEEPPDLGRQVEAGHPRRGRVGVDEPQRGIVGRVLEAVHGHADGEPVQQGRAELFLGRRAEEGHSVGEGSGGAVARIVPNDVRTHVGRRE